MRGSGCHGDANMDNADLQKLRATPGKLFPRFSPSVTEYSITVASSVSEVKLTVLTSESGASYCIKGDASSKVVQLVEGVSVQVLVVVTAEDGATTKIYTVSMRRLSSKDAFLSDLEISAGVLQPCFSPLTFAYYCTVPCHLDSLTLRPKTEDPAMKVTLYNGGAVGRVELNAGLTVVELLVASVDGSKTSTYSIHVSRRRCPFPVELLVQKKEKAQEGLMLECVGCEGVVHCPCSVDGSPSHLYCRQCLEQLTRINKVDPISGTLLGQGWMKTEHDLEQELSAMEVVAITPAGHVQTTLSKIGSLVAQRYGSLRHKDQEDCPSCPQCSKKVPSGLLVAHQKLICSAQSSSNLPKVEISHAGWQTRMVDDSLPSDLEAVLKQGSHWEQHYLSLCAAGEGSAEVMEALNKAATCYATAIKLNARNHCGHLGLALVLEETFYAEHMLGHREVEGRRDDGEEESDAERTSKEEEFLAICELHGVGPKAGLVVQLKAVEKEYHQLKESGHGHKSEHVQQLYAWKSRQALQASKCSYAGHSEGPLKMAEIKLHHAFSAQPSDHASCYHLGRVKLLLGEISEAEKFLLAASAMKPCHTETALCLGLALSAPKERAQFLHYGLLHYMDMKEKEAEGVSQPQVLHGHLFWRSSNILIGQALLMLADAGGHQQMDARSCLLLLARLFLESSGLAKGSTQRQLLWLLLQAKARLLRLSQKREEESHTVQKVQQLSALIAHCQLPSSEALLALQMEVFQMGVSLQPGSSQALSHLGNGQLMQYEATEDSTWLSLAQLSFEASMECEGLPVHCKTAPAKLQQQQWWKEKVSLGAAAEPTGKITAQKNPSSQVAVTKKPPSISLSTSSHSSTQRGKQVHPAQGKQTAMPTGRQVSGKAVTERGKGRPAGTKVAKGTKGVATLGEIKAGSDKMPAVKMTSKEPNKPHPLPAIPVVATEAGVTPTVGAITAGINEKPTSSCHDNKEKKNLVTFHARLGLARVLAHLATKGGKPSERCVLLYQEVIKMAPQVHDAYIELGEMLAKHDAPAAVAVYSKFPFSFPPTFDDAYLHGEIVRLLMASKSYDDQLLISSMVAMGQALGIGVLEKHVKVLESVFKTTVLKKVYAGVHGKSIDDPGMQAFFKFKCWL